MKKISIIFILALNFTVFYGCGTKTETEYNGNIAKIELIADNNIVAANKVNKIEFTIKAYDEDNNMVKTTGIKLYQDGSEKKELYFITDIEGEYNFIAKIGNIKSNNIVVTAKKNFSIRLMAGVGLIPYERRYVKNLYIDNVSYTMPKMNYGGNGQISQDIIISTGIHHFKWEDFRYSNTNHEIGNVVREYDFNIAKDGIIMLTETGPQQK